MKLPVILAAGAGTLAAVWVGWGLYSIYSTERPPYRLLRSLDGGVEIRQYKEQTWISTSYRGDGPSFSVLASYIFGRNESEEKVGMTAPVVTDDRMSFILPAGYTAENAPTPEGQAIEFTTVPARKVAALSFSWYATSRRVERKTDELLNALRADGSEMVSRPFLMRYNDPFTPPFLRRNEVAIEVR